MASIEKYEKAGKTAWLARYTTYVNGQRKQHKKSGFAKEREAKAFATRIEAQIVNNEYVEKSGTTLAEYMDTYLELYCTGLSPKTIEAYTCIAKRIKRSALAQMTLQQIDSESIQIYLKTLMEEPRHKTCAMDKKEGKARYQGKPLSANSALHYVRFLNLVLERAVMNKKIPHNPCRHVVKPKIQKHKHIILTAEEYAKLLESVKSKPMYIPILLGGYMGMRRGEALGLTWPDVDFKNHTISIRQTKQKVGADVIFKEPKTEKSTRTLHMPQVVEKALQEHKNNIVIDISHKLVCSESTGEPISINTFTQRYKQALKTAGMNDNMRFHDLRHSAAALLLAAGANPKEISDYLGHSNIGITMDLYADIFEQTKKDTAQKLDSLMSTHFKG